MATGDPICGICGFYNCNHMDAGLRTYTGSGPIIAGETFKSGENVSFDRNEFDRIQREKNKITCPVCGSDKLLKYKVIRDDTQEVEYLCHCSKCGEDGDFANINDQIYYWSQLPVLTKFDHYSDNRDEGPNGKIIKYKVDYSRGPNDPERIKKI